MLSPFSRALVLAAVALALVVACLRSAAVASVYALPIPGQPTAWRTQATVLALGFGLAAAATWTRALVSAQRYTSGPERKRPSGLAALAVMLTAPVLVGVYTLVMLLS